MKNKIKYAVIILLIGGMIMSYTRVNWQNAPSTATPVNAENLNTMDKGIADAHSQLASTVKKVNGQPPDATGNVVIEIPAPDLTPYATKIEVEAKADKSYVDSITQSIASGSPKGVYATVADLNNAFPAGDTNIYLVTADGNWYYWNGSAWTAGGVYQATGSSDFPVTNIVINGDFSEGTTAWSPVNSTHNANNNVMTNTADGTATYGIERQRLSNLIIGHKYYVRAKIKVTNDVCSYIRLRMNYSEVPNYDIKTPVGNTEYNIANIFIPTATSSDIQFMHAYADASTANGKIMELQYVLVIDLTDAFGLGKEPTVEEMNDMMSRFSHSWFSGTIAPFLDNKDLYERIKSDNHLSGRTITGTPNQITVTNGDGVEGNPIIGIPEGATEIFRPAITAVTYGDELAPPISTWIGENGAVWNGTAWVIPPKGTIKANVEVEKDAEYQINITWTDTNSYNTLLVDPKMVVSLGTTVSEPQFTGYSDALYKLTLIAGESGVVELKLGDGIEDWSATISNISVKKVTGKVTKAGKIGVGVFDIYTGGTNFALGGGHSKRTTGTSNNAIGYQAQNDLTTGNYNNAIGTYAQQSITTGLNNNAFGHEAQRYLKSGYYNVAIGYAAQYKLESGSWNIGIGNECQRDITTGDMNTSIGSRAHNSLTTGSCNVAIGRHAGFYPKGLNNPTTTANYQTTIGTQSGQSSSTQADNLTAIGYRAVGTTNATAIGANTEAKGVGSVAIGLDSEGNYAQANNDNEFVLGTEKHNVKVKGTFNIARYTPTGTSDTRGQVGDITSDDNYIYIKTAAGWKRSALSTW